MPIYEYKCESCGRQIEVFQKIDESPLTSCPNCGKSALSKLISAAGFQLKGSGWYATDYKNKTPPSQDKAPASEKETSPKSNETKETKSNDNAKGSPTSSDKST